MGKLGKPCCGGGVAFPRELGECPPTLHSQMVGSLPFPDQPHLTVPSPQFPEQSPAGGCSGEALLLTGHPLGWSVPHRTQASWMPESGDPFRDYQVGVSSLSYRLCSGACPAARQEELTFRAVRLRPAVNILFFSALFFFSPNRISHQYVITGAALVKARLVRNRPETPCSYPPLRHCGS